MARCGLSSKDFAALFTADKPIIFTYHGYPWLIHRLTYRRTHHDNLHGRGSEEEGTSPPSFDRVLRMDSLHRVANVIDRVAKLGYHAAYAKQAIRDNLIEHREYGTTHGDNTADIRSPLVRLMNDHAVNQGGGASSMRQMR